MILLDTDHLTVLRYRDSERYEKLTERLRLSNETVGTTVVNVEEQMRGWIAAIAKEKKVARQEFAYRELADLFAFFAKLEIAAFTDGAAAQFEFLPQKCESVRWISRSRRLRSHTARNY